MDKVGLQLYSLKHLTARDLKGSIHLAGQMGYKGMEFAGYFGHDAQDLKAFLTEEGLECCGTHLGMDILTGDLEGAIAYSRALGVPYMICPALPYDYHATKEAWLKTADLFEKIGKKVNAAGMGFAYHTHAYCFDEFDGEFGIDLLFENTSPEIVKLQYDVGNSEVTGKFKSVDYMKKHAARMELLHMKDFAGIGKEDATPVGDGIADWDGIISLGRELGVKWYTVEYEGTTGDIEGAVAKSFQYLKRYL